MGETYFLRPDFLNQYLKQKRVKEEMASYSKALEQHSANQKAYDDLLNFDVNAGQEEINNLESLMPKANELKQNLDTLLQRSDIDTPMSPFLRPATNPFGVYDPKKSKEIDAAEKELQQYLSNIGYSSIDELRNAINQKKQYLNDAKSTQSAHAALSKYKKRQEENAEEINSRYADMNTKKENYVAGPLDWLSKGIESFMYGYNPKDVAATDEEREYLNSAWGYYSSKYGTEAEQQELLNLFKQSGDSRYSQEIKELTHSLYGDSAFDEYIGDNIEAGAWNFFYETAATFNAITSIFGLPIDETKAYQDLKKIAEAQNTYASNAAIALGDTDNIGGNLIQAAMAFIPDLILTVATKGSSGSGATAKSLGKIASAGIKTQKTASMTNKFLKYGSGMLDAVSKGISATAKNPMFWTSFSRTFGTDYETALEGGADTTTAYLYATITSITNALVEIGGGVETRLPDVISGKSKFQILDFIKECLEEGNEEVIQGVITNLNQLLYDSDKEFFSFENEDAIINPSRMLKEHAMGTLGGAVLGGGTKIGQRIISGSTRGITLAGKNAIRNNIVSDLAEFGRTAADENVRAVSESFLTTGKITNYDAGVLFAHAQKQINYDLNLAKTPVKTRAAIQKYIKGDYPEAIKQMVIGNEIAKMYDISGIASKVSQREYSFSTNENNGGISDGNINSQALSQQFAEIPTPQTVNNIPASRMSIAHTQNFLEELPEKEYNKLTTKKVVRVHREVFAAVNSARTQRYGDMATEEIPIIDIINLGEYGVLNSNDFYFIRNANRIDFSIIKHAKTLKGRTAKKYDIRRGQTRNSTYGINNSENGRVGSEGGYNNSDSHNRPLTDKSALGKDAGETEFLGKSNGPIGSGNRPSDFGRRVEINEEAQTPKDFSLSTPKSIYTEPDLTTQKPQTLEERTMANIIGGDAQLTDGQRRVNSIARLLKMEPVWDVVGDPEVVGKGYYENGVIHLNKQAPALTTVYLHEFCHRLQRSGNWNAFVSFSRSTPVYAQWICEKGGSADFATAEANYKAQIKKAYESKTGSAYNDTRLTNEIMARFISEKMMVEYASGQNTELATATEHFLTEIAKHRKWYHIVMDWISEMINRLARRTEQADFLKFQRMLKQAYNDVQSRAAQVDGGREWSAEKGFSEQVDDVLAGTHNPRLDLYVAQTPKYLVDLNFSEGPLLMRNSKVSEILEKHPEISEKTLKSLPAILQNPLLVLKSKTHPAESVVIITEVLTTKGEIVVPIWINQEGTYLDVNFNENSANTNFVASSYGRNIKSLLDYANANDGFLYQSEDIEKVRHLLARNGLQLPTPLRISDSDINIPQKTQDVNTQYMQNSRDYSFDEGDIGKRTPAKIYAKELLQDTGSSYETELLAKDIEKIYAAADKGDATLKFSYARDTAAKILNDIEGRDFSKEGANAGENALKSLTNDIINHIDEETHSTLNRVRAENKRLKHTVNDFEAAQQRQTNRNVIRKSINRLDKKFRANSNSKHVHDDLKKAIKIFLEIFLDNSPNAFDERNVHKLRTIYNRFVKNQTDLTLDPDTEEKLNFLAEVMENKRISTLSDSELQVVRELAEHFEHLVTSANEIFIEGRKENFSAIANEEAERLKKFKDKHELNLGTGKFGKFVDSAKEFLNEGNLKPVYFFDKLGGVYKKLFNDISAGLDKTIKNLKKTTDMLQNIIKKYGYWSWVDKKQKITLGHADGQRITLTLGEAMSVLATYKREKNNKDTQESSHLSQGGIVLKNRQIVSQIEKTAKEKQGSFEKLIEHQLITAWASSPFIITEADIKEIREQLGKEKEDFLDELVNIMSTFGAEMGNETSKKLYGYSKFGEPYYFPYETSSLYLQRELDKKQAQKTLTGKSFTKNTVEAANTPLVISDFMEVFCKHMTEMCEYNGLAVPLDNLKRVSRFSERADETKAAFSLTNELNRAYGAATVNYLNKFIEDVDGGIAGQQAGDNIAGSLISLFQKNAVAANLSVVIQQPSSIMRATAYIEPKYLFAKGSKFTNAAWEECQKYNGVAIQKEMGRFDIGNPKSTFDYMTDRQYKGLNNKAKGFVKDENYRDNLLSKAASKADQYTWCTIWNACKAKARDMLVSRVKEAKIYINGIKRFDSSNVDTENNMRKIAKMSSVYNVQSEKLNKTGKKPSELFSDFFDSLGNEIFIEQFGKISLSKSSVKSEIRHGITAEKLASLEAIPDVLKNGEVIFAETKPDSDVERIVVCAPITIGNEPYYMGVMLQRDSQMQRLYLHNVVIEKEMPGTSQADLLTTGALEDTRHLFMTSILQKAVAVKNKYMQNPDSYSTNQIDFEEQVKLEAAKLFKEVIEHTQVYDSVLSRSQNMRSKSVWTRMATAFMGEPTTNLNMLHKALWDAKAGNIGAATKGVIGVLSATLLNAILKSLITAMRDDEEDKSYGEKYITEVGGNFLSDANPIGWVPVMKDVLSIFEGYQVKRADMNLVQDLYYGLSALSSTKKTTWEKILAVANPVSAMCGLPVENVARDIGAVINTITTAVNDENEHTHGFKYAFLEGLPGEDSYAKYYEIMRDAQKKGNTQKYNELKEYLMGRGKTEKEIESGVKAAYSESKAVAKKTDDYFALLAKNALFGKLPEEKQADVKTAVKRYLTESAMKDATGREMSKTNQKALEAQKKGSSAVNYFLAKASFEDTDNSGGISNEEKIAAINKMNISALEKQALIMLYTKK